MTRKPRILAACLPLSEMPELRELLAPFLGPAKTRGHVVMMRLGDEPVERLDQLVEAGLFGSRSEAAAFLVGAGIQGQKELFAKIGRHSAEIRKIRQSLRTTALATLREATRDQTKKPPRRKRR